jgi:hypothetical protein
MRRDLMKPTRRLKMVAAALAIGVGGAVAAIGPAQPAVAFFSGPLLLDVQVESPATLVARGAAVRVPIEFTCTSTEASIGVTVTEAVGGNVAKGSAFTTATCTGKSQRLAVAVTATAGGKAFTKGEAFGEAVVAGCADATCGIENDEEVIKISK